MATDIDNITKPANGDLVGHPTDGIQAEMRGLKASWKYFRERFNIGPLPTVETVITRAGITFSTVSGGGSVVNCSETDSQNMTGGVVTGSTIKFTLAKPFASNVPRSVTSGVYLIGGGTPTGYTFRLTQLTATEITFTCIQLNAVVAVPVGINVFIDLQFYPA